MSAIVTENLDLYYGSFHALKGVNLSVQPRLITALIGPSGCGKSTLLRTFNRMNDLIPGVKVTGSVRALGQDVYDPKTDLVALRRRLGMVFQRPNPFPLSIRENVAFAARIHRTAQGSELDDRVEASLKSVLLWDQFQNQLHKFALTLTLEQQQRLCIARLLTVEPEIILLDEPCSALDPYSTLHIEDLMRQLSQNYTILIVTHNMQQAARASDRSAFMLLGELVEEGPTGELFATPKDERTEQYITGRYG
jgi:phosphate transport system ATP-binding protein